MPARLFFAFNGDVSFKASVSVVMSVRISSSCTCTEVRLRHKAATDTSASMYVWVRSLWVLPTTSDSFSCMLASFIICALCPTKAIAAFVAFSGDSSIIGVDCCGIGVAGGGIGVAGGGIGGGADVCGVFIAA